MITEKLTRSKDYKSPEELAKIKKQKEKLEKQKIRDEILAPEPVSEMDMKLYSGTIAVKSENSKSEV